MIDIVIGARHGWDWNLFAECLAAGLQPIALVCLVWVILRRQD